jgi:hypothetical protein
MKTNDAFASRFLDASTAALGVAGLAAWPFLAQMSPDAAVRPRA